MKKITIVAVIATMALTSCVKTYTCSCTLTPAGTASGYIKTPDLEYKVVRSQKSIVKASCESISDSDETCVLK